MTRPTAQRSAFDRGQLTQLESILGRQRLRELLPAFEQAVVSYRATGGKTSISLEEATSDTARKHVQLAKNAQKGLEQLDAALEALNAVTEEGVSSGYVDLTPVGTLATLGMPEEEQPRTWPGLRAKTTLKAVATAVRTWESRAALDVPRKPGRKIGDRVQLAEWVGIRLARAGVRLTKSADGTWAQTVSVMYEAAGVKVPQSLYPDIAAAHRYLKRFRPDLWSVSGTTKTR